MRSGSEKPFGRRISREAAAELATYLMVSPSAAGSLSSAGFARDLCALLSRFRQTDCNRLLPALHGPPTPAGFERSLFPPTHRALDALRGRLTVFPAA